MEYELEPNICSYCKHKQKHKNWNKFLSLMCSCGHVFGDHMGYHPHKCGNEVTHDDGHCEEFSPAAIYGPPKPTAEEIYESLRDS